MTVYIIDIIGKHSGAHFYNKSFRETLELKYKTAKILSNYSDHDEKEVPLLKNYYEGKIINKIYKFVYSLIRYYLYLLRHCRNYFVFLSYGNASEIFFAWPLIFCRRKIVDVHEVISLVPDNRISDISRKSVAGLLYNHIADAVILHSARSEELLSGLNFRKKRLFIPHFPYDTGKDFKESTVPEEVRSLISQNRVNILFFGYIRLSKGIEHVIRTAERIAGTKIGEAINLIVAGNDPKLIVKSLIKNNSGSVLKSLSCLLRYISDDELKYLFTKTDFVLLPYTQISQSGVMEMAVHFRKPLITSPLDYFKEFLDRYPSFGIYCSNETEALISLFEKISREHEMDHVSFYLESDILRFMNDKNTGHFLEELETVFPNNDA